MCDCACCYDVHVHGIEKALRWSATLESSAFRSVPPKFTHVSLPAFKLANPRST